MMMDVNTMGQMLRDSKMVGNLRQPQAPGFGLGGNRGASGLMMGAGQASGIPGLGMGSSATAFQDQIAVALAQAELAAQSAMSAGPVDQEAARNLAQIKAMGLQNEMLNSLAGLDQGSESNAVNLVGRANIEAAMMSSGYFGNLLGQKGGQPVLDTGRKLSPSEMTSLQQKVRGLKSGPLRKRAASTENSPTEAKEANLRMPYGLTRSRALKEDVSGADLKAHLDYWVEDPLKGLDQTQMAQSSAADRASSLKMATAQPVSTRNSSVAQSQVDSKLNSESEILAAQKKDASSGLENDFTREELDKLVDKVSLALGLDRNLVMAVIKTESNFNHKAVSRAGAKGLMQLMPGTAKDLGVADPFNPVENVWAGARYLKKMLDRHGGNLNKALASYNWGPGNFDRYGKSGKMPNETRRYISIVNQHYASFKKADSGQA